MTFIETFIADKSSKDFHKIGISENYYLLLLMFIHNIKMYNKDHEQRSRKENSDYRFKQDINLYPGLQS
jgi:hypothetical protein